MRVLHNSIQSTSRSFQILKSRVPKLNLAGGSHCIFRHHLHAQFLCAYRENCARHFGGKHVNLCQCNKVFLSLQIYKAKPRDRSIKMGSTGNDSDEPLTPVGRLFIQPEMDLIIHCTMGLKDPIDVDAVKETIKDSPMLKLPRFCSLLVHDKHGFEFWRRTEVDMDRHIIPVNIQGQQGCSSCDEEGAKGDDDVDRIVNDYVADLCATTPLSTDKPLWEIHLLMEQRCAVLRIHHALGDGVSVMSMFSAMCRRGNDPTTAPSMVMGGGGRSKERGGGGRKGKDFRKVLLGLLTMVWFSIVYCMEFLLRFFCIHDQKTVFTGGDGVELWPRKLATAKFSIEDMKVVKKAVGNATINDVLLGVISCGLSRYLDHRSPNAIRDGLQLTGVVMVNLRDQSGLQDASQLAKTGSLWGNKIGIFLLPVCCDRGGVDPLLYVRKAKALIDRKKQSLEASFSYWIGDLVMSWLGSKAAYVLSYTILCNTTFTISNMVGPVEEITFVGNHVTYLRVTTSSLPHALTMHMVSYKGRAEMQILVAKDLIPDPEFLAKCFEDALLAMKEASTAAV